MAQNERPPRTEEVDVLAAVHVPEAGARTTRDEERLTADAAEGAHRAVDTARHHGGRAIPEPLRVALWCLRRGPGRLEVDRHELAALGAPPERRDRLRP